MAARLSCCCGKLPRQGWEASEVLGMSGKWGQPRSFQGAKKNAPEGAFFLVSASATISIDEVVLEQFTVAAQGLITPLFVLQRAEVGLRRVPRALVGGRAPRRRQSLIVTVQLPVGLGQT